jgi:Ca2+:H+ antiporter
MLVAGLGLSVPTIYYTSITASDNVIVEHLDLNTLRVSHGAAIVLLVAFFMYVWFQSRSHHGLYEDILKGDEERGHNRQRDLAKAKLTLTEALIAVAISIMFVTFMAVFLVHQIEYIVHRGVSDQFMGLILLPLVEKASEHLTAVNKAYGNQMNFALAHVLGASIQTALLNAPLVVIVAWGLNYNISVNFELFDAVILILSIIIVSIFLRDEKSDYLEGAMCVFVYLLVAVAAFFYPNAKKDGGH